MGRDWTLQNPQDVLEAQLHVWSHGLGFIRFMTLKCVIELGIPDAIHDHGRPMTLDELVSATEIQPSKAHCLHRIMRLLVHSGLFELYGEPAGGDDGEGGAYALNDVSALLTGSHPLCSRASVLAFMDTSAFKTWSSATAWLQNNDPTPYETAHGEKIWDRLATDPEFNDVFNGNVGFDARLFGSVLLDRHKSVFAGLNSLVDVGGGNGSQVRAIASAFPDMEFTVMDLPHVVAGLQGTDNLKFVPGDMFQCIPPANAVMMKSVLHDWDDEASLKVLQKCREAIPPKEEGGKLIIIDVVVVGPAGDYKLRESQLSISLAMMVDCLGKERTEKEWVKLFSDAGFSSYNFNPAIGLQSVIEVYP